MRVLCTIEEIELDGDYATVEGLQATCRRCDHQAEVFGTSDRSVRACLALMREECPRGESNFYVSGDEDDA